MDKIVISTEEGIYFTTEEGLVLGKDADAENAGIAALHDLLLTTDLLTTGTSILTTYHLVISGWALLHREGCLPPKLSTEVEDVIRTYSDKLADTVCRERYKQSLGDAFRRSCSVYMKQGMLLRRARARFLEKVLGDADVLGPTNAYFLRAYRGPRVEAAISDSESSDDEDDNYAYSFLTYCVIL